jgi:hypothetical protein
MWTFVDPRASFRGRSPVRRGSEVALPERPGAALERPHRIDPARELAIPPLQETTISRPAILGQRSTDAHATNVLSGETLARPTQERGDLANLPACHKDIPGRSGAACSALLTSEAQTVVIPRLIWNRVHPYTLTITAPAAPCWDSGSSYGRAVIDIRKPVGVWPVAGSVGFPWPTWNIRGRLRFTSAMGGTDATDPRFSRPPPRGFAGAAR